MFLFWSAGTIMETITPFDVVHIMSRINAALCLLYDNMQDDPFSNELVSVLRESTDELKNAYDDVLEKLTSRTKQ